ncbi:MAG: phosphoribosylformylglycinamidine cyclo-ligase [Myxococcota bacterium]
MADEGVSYKDAGVDIEKADEFVDRIRALPGTRGPGLLGGLGGFAALFSLREGVPGFADMEDPVLVSGTDGVGTKLKVAFAAERHDTIGQDLVAMCVNDLVTTGARPLFFLDYFGTGALEPSVAAEVVRGIGRACEAAGCLLVGGETAELPGMYAAGEYDLAGFAVGIVDRARMVSGSEVVAGDLIVGLSSSGLHSNGYSLARRVLPLDAEIETRPVADVLLEPTLLYVKASELLTALSAKAHAHITGGGIPGNLPRVLPKGVRARIDLDSWPMPAVFRAIAERGPVAGIELFKTFNMGLGWLSVVAPADAAEALRVLREAGYAAQVVGAIEAADAPELEADVRFEPVLDDWKGP